MSLANYAALQAAITSRATRTYSGDQVTDSIDLAEARIIADLGSGVESTHTSLTMTIGQITTTHNPTTSIIRALRYAQADGGDIIESCSPERWADVKTSQRGQPTHFLPRSATIEWNCPPDKAYAVEAEIFGALDISTTSTNWVLSYVPQLYLAGAMLELMAGPERNLEEWKLWEGVYERSLMNARRLINRVTARNEVRLNFDDVPSGGGDSYDIKSDD